MELVEQHLIIDWSNAISEDNMKTHINEHGLNLTDIIKIPKLENKCKTITEFYNVGFKVNDERGATDFTLYLVNSPCCYGYRKTTKGDRLVNTKLFDLKKFLRKKVSSQIHATDNIQETKDNLKVLGLYEKHYIRREFKDISEVFDVLNKLEDFKYVIMRNFEGIPDDITIDEHLDVDLMVSDYYKAKCALDATSVFTGKQSLEDGGWRILNSVLIDGKAVWFDLRHIGDDYYEINLENELLNKRVPCKNFYIPGANTHKYTLIYHALIHKPKISETYKNIFKKLGLPTRKKELRKLLDDYMSSKKFNYVKPNDDSVGFHIDWVATMKYSRSINATSDVKIDIENDVVIKKFTCKPNTYCFAKVFPDMYDREEHWLKKLSDSGITPGYISSDKRLKSVTMSYAGEYLTKQNMPKDYEEQIKNIIDVLKQYNCSHNDIKPSELLILDGKIKIIDFAWSTEIGKPISTNWPKEIGSIFRYKVHNFNDEYSLKKSINWILNEN